MSSLHVIFGAGQIGSSLARLLQSRGHLVRVVRRSPAPVGPGIEVIAGDARDAAFVRKSAEGADVLYHVMNPSAYTAEAWEQEFPALGEGLIAATGAARLVCLDNLYGYGVVEGRRTEATPMQATGRKGKVRVAWDARVRAAAAAGVRITVGRAGDFFGPGTADNSFFGPRMIQGITAGRRTWLIGDPHAPHAFSYVPDVVAGLAALGTAGPDVDGEIFHLPIQETTPAALVAAIATAAHTQSPVSALPGWLVRLLGVGVPLFRELSETLYQWDRPFFADDQKFRARFPGLATELEVAVRRTAA